jgi:hypothetical protein
MFASAWLECVKGFTFTSGSNNGEISSADNETRQSQRNSRRKRKHSPDEAAPAAPIDPLSDLYAVLEG